jgi:hypothetical protein
VGCPYIRESIKETHTINLHAMVGRLELYVQEEKWKASDKRTEAVLFTIVCQVEKMLKKGVLRHWNIERGKIFENECKRKERVIDGAKLLFPDDTSERLELHTQGVRLHDLN